MNLSDIFDFFDCPREPDNKKVKNTKPIVGCENTEQMKKINCLDTFEYLRFVNENLYYQKQIATKEYKASNKHLYDDFISNNIIKSSKGKYTLEYYLKEQYALSNECLENIGYTILLKNGIIRKASYFFKEEKIHDKINISINVDNKILGLLFDKGLAFLYDNTINYLEIVKSIKSEQSILKLFAEKEINTSDDMLKELFGDQLNKAKECLDKLFTNIKVNKMIYLHKNKIYGYPDLVADDCIIDIKTSKNNILNSKNYLQILSYGLCAKVKNVYLYDIENGKLYCGKISDDSLWKMNDYIKEKSEEISWCKYEKKIDRKSYYIKRMKKADECYDNDSY